MDFWKWPFIQCNTAVSELKHPAKFLMSTPCIKLLSLKIKSRLWIIETSCIWNESQVVSCWRHAWNISILPANLLVFRVPVVGDSQNQNMNLTSTHNRGTLIMNVYNKQTFFTSQDVNRCTGVVWIIVMFLSAVWTLILTAPIHCGVSIGEQAM